MTEPEVLDSLDQFRAKHLILFEGVENPGVEEAFRKWEALGKGRVHRAKISGKPGLFQLTTEQVAGFASSIPLENPDHATCLLLRTSGTTARPKLVILTLCFVSFICQIMCYPLISWTLCIFTHTRYGQQGCPSQA